MIKTVVVACAVMEPELNAAKDGNGHAEIRYLDQGLHRTPDKMAAKVQGEIDAASEYADRIVLGYGLCSNGIVGVKAPKQGLIVPRCHDCISFFLGSPALYMEYFHARPGTYYLTPGWIAERKDPKGIMEEDYMPKFGPETALWVIKEELKHYTHISLINNGIGELSSLRARAKENAEMFEMEYEEIQGTLDFFRKLLTGPYPEDEFLHLKPGEEIKQALFLDGID